MKRQGLLALCLSSFEGSPPAAAGRGDDCGASLIPLANAANAASLSAQASGAAAPCIPAGQMKVYKVLVSLLVLTAITLLDMAVIVSMPASPVHAISSNTGLHVSGNQILNSSGQTVRPLGVNRAGSEYMCVNSTNVFDGLSDANSISAMINWHINTVRLPLNEDCWLGINGLPQGSLTASAYQQAIVSYVNMLTSQNLVTILDLHWNAPAAQRATSQQIMPDADHAAAFWSSVAGIFKSNSSVIFDLYNEPHPQSWSCWLNGSSAANASPCSDVPFAVIGMQNLVNAVRGTGATNILMAGGLAWANDLSGWLNNEPKDPLNDLAASFHLYNFNGCSNTGCWNAQVAPVAAKVPVITGEMGENDCASTFINTAMAWLDQHNAGYLGWAWNTASCNGFPALITDYNGTPTPFGLGLKNHLTTINTNSGSAPTAAPTATIPATPSTVAGASCTVHYMMQGQWQGGFTGSITITNSGTTAINGWTLTFTLPSNQQIQNGWNATFSQQGSQVTAVNASFNASLPANGSTFLAFNVSPGGNNLNPTAFSLNGAVCSAL